MKLVVITLLVCLAALAVQVRAGGCCRRDRERRSCDNDDHHDDDDHHGNDNNDDHHEDDHHEEEQHEEDDHHDEDDTTMHYAQCEMEPNSHMAASLHHHVHGSIELSQQGHGAVYLEAHLVGFNTSEDHDDHHHGLHLHMLGDMSEGCDSIGELYNAHPERHEDPGDLGDLVDDDRGVVNEVHHYDWLDIDGTAPNTEALIGHSMVILQGSHNDVDSPLTRIACCVIGHGKTRPEAAAAHHELEEDHTQHYAHCDVRPNTYQPQNLHHHVHGTIDFVQDGFGDLQVTYHLEGFNVSDDYADHLHDVQIYENGDMTHGCDNLGDKFDPHADYHSELGDLGDIHDDDHGVVNESHRYSWLNIFGEDNILGRAIAIHQRDHLHESAKIACCVVGRGASQPEVHHQAKCIMRSNTEQTSLHHHVTGTVTFEQTPGGAVHMRADLTGFNVSEDLSHHRHGVQLHEWGDLSHGCHSLGRMYHGHDGDASDRSGDLGDVIDDSHGNVHTTRTFDHLNVEDLFARSLVILQGGHEVESERIACCIIGRA